LGRIQVAVPANPAGYRPHATSGWSIIAEKARLPRKATERGHSDAFWLQSPAAPSGIRPAHIDGPSRRPVDGGGQAASVLEQAPLLVRLKADIGEAGEVQHRPEAIAAAGEVVTSGCGGRGRVHAAEDHVEIAGENVRFIRAQIRSLHYGLGAVARWRSDCIQAAYRWIEVDAPAR
jgi:hypothetical protein